MGAQCADGESTRLATATLQLRGASTRSCRYSCSHDEQRSSGMGFLMRYSLMLRCRWHEGHSRFDGDSLPSMLNLTVIAQTLVVRGVTSSRHSSEVLEIERRYSIALLTHIPAIDASLRQLRDMPRTITRPAFRPASDRPLAERQFSFHVDSTSDREQV